jgi:holo-[acyl-carrier protein] synthase
MILGIGLDICDAKRLKRAMLRPGFGARVFDETERRQCQRRARCHLHYAARFAAKEAYFKAIGTGWNRGVTWQDVGVRSDGASPPTVEVSGVARRLSRELGVSRVHLSLSHSGDYAVAVVVLEGRPARDRRRGRRAP